MKSALARTMQIQRTAVTSRFEKRSSRSRKLTASPETRPWQAEGGGSPAALCIVLRQCLIRNLRTGLQARSCTSQPRSEVLLRVENEGDGFLDAEPFALFLHEPGDGLDERRLV